MTLSISLSVVLVELIALYYRDKLLGIARIGGISTLAKTPRPTLVVGDFFAKQRLITLPLQKERMVGKTLCHSSVAAITSTLPGLTYHLPTPVATGLYTKMIEPHLCQITRARRTLKYPLRQRYSRRYAIFLAVLYRSTAITLDVTLALLIAVAQRRIIVRLLHLIYIVIPRPSTLLMRAT